MKTIIIAGSWSSGTTAIAGALDQLGASTAPPYLQSNDPKNPNVFESLSFRKIILSYASENPLSVDRRRSREIQQQLRSFRQELANQGEQVVALKMPLASICMPELVPALDPHIIVVTRPMENIEATRRRRKWPALYGQEGAQAIYSRLFGDLIALERSFLTVAYPAFVNNTAGELKRIIGFSELSVTDESLASAIAFVRH